MAKKNSAADEIQTAGIGESGAVDNTSSPTPPTVAPTVCPHRGKGGSYVVDDATQTRTPNQQPIEE
jgi:hypothetical protein